MYEWLFYFPNKTNIIYHFFCIYANIRWFIRVFSRFCAQACIALFLFKVEHCNHSVRSREHINSSRSSPPTHLPVVGSLGLSCTNPDLPFWHLSHSHNSPTSNSATGHIDIYRGNSTLTLFEPSGWYSCRSQIHCALLHYISANKPDPLPQVLR